MSATPAATLFKTTGPVYAERQGTRVALAEGDPVFASDTIITDSTATADLHFRDGATARLSPDTRLDVREFAFGEGVEPSFMLGLMQGAMRSVSGEVVKQNPEAFQIATPQATVGIRGTELFNAVMGGKEMHAVIFISQGHVVVVTAADGRTVTMDSAMQAVNLTGGDMGPLTIQKFSLTEMEDVIRSLAPTLAGKFTTGSGAEEEEPASVVLASSTSTVVLVAMDAASAESAGALQAGLEGEGHAVRLLDAGALGSGEGDSLLGELMDRVGQIFEAVPVADSGGGGGGGEPGITYVERTFPGGNVSNGIGLTHLAGLDPNAAQDFQVPGTVSGPLVGNALFIGGMRPFALLPDAPTALSLSTAGDIFTVGTLTGGSAYDGIDAGIYGDAVMAAVRPDAGLTLGSDQITVGSMGGDSANGGIVYGDVQQAVVDGGLLTFGNDTISAGSMKGQDSNGSLIYGDAESITVSNASAVLGNDSIDVVTLTKGAIYGDAYTASVASGAHLTSGNDAITVDSMGSSAAIYGDAYAAGVAGTLTFGNDTITVDSMDGGAIYGDAHGINGNGTVTLGSNKIVVGSMAGGFIYGNANDMTSFTGGTSGGGNEIEVTSLYNGKIYGGQGDDRITVDLFNGNGASIDGGAGNDTILVKLVDAARPLTINGGTGDDVITVNSLVKGDVIIDARSGSDTMNVGLDAGAGRKLTIQTESANTSKTYDWILDGATRTGITVTMSGGTGADVLNLNLGAEWIGESNSAQDVYNILISSNNLAIQTG